jgi:hypothetical protein
MGGPWELLLGKSACEEIFTKFGNFSIEYLWLGWRQTPRALLSS